MHLSQTQAAQINSAIYVRVTRTDSLKNKLSANKRTNHMARTNIMMTAERQIMYMLNSRQKQQFLQWEKIRKEKAMERKNTVDTVQG